MGSFFLFSDLFCFGKSFSWPLNRSFVLFLLNKLRKSCFVFNTLFSVGIGALCSDLAECDHGSTCVMGRCTCVSPLIQHEGKCVLRQQQKVVGKLQLHSFQVITRNVNEISNTRQIQDPANFATMARFVAKEAFVT